MQLQTIVPIIPLTNKVTYRSHIVSLGSCFAVSVAHKLSQFQFQNSVNPFGILFHPVAVSNAVQFAVDSKEFSEVDVFLYNEIWSSFDAHSDMNALEQEDIIAALNTKTKMFREALVSASHFILTLGTAWVYTSNETHQPVANCHKVPQKHFTKTLLSVEEITASLNTIRKNILKINPAVQLICTISPVRHIKDGFVENQRSKAHLIAAVHQFSEQHPEIYYFPSYEIVMDELRDYRFFEKDMLHPNASAVDYIWEIFMENCIESSCIPTMKLVDEVHKGLAHRAFNPYSAQHQQFLDALAYKLDVLLEQYPFMKFR